MSITEGSKQFLGPILGVKQTPKTNGYSSQHEQKDVFSPKQGKCNSNCPNLCRFGTKVAKRQGRDLLWHLASERFALKSVLFGS